MHSKTMALVRADTGLSPQRDAIAEATADSISKTSAEPR